jgi:hypothetical protein
MERSETCDINGTKPKIQPGRRKREVRAVAGRKNVGERCGGQPRRATSYLEECEKERRENETTK